MSTKYQPKNKIFAQVNVMSSQTYSNNRGRFMYVGSINRGFTNFITTQRNSKTGQCSFIEDTSVLTKKTKNEVVRFFAQKNNRNKGVAYLVVPRAQVSASAGNKKKVK